MHSDKFGVVGESVDHAHTFGKQIGGKFVTDDYSADLVSLWAFVGIV